MLSYSKREEPQHGDSHDKTKPTEVQPCAAQGQTPGTHGGLSSIAFAMQCMS